jgi:hypothetical protein
MHTLKSGTRAMFNYPTAFNAAREAARAAGGPRWFLDPAISLKARVPASWLAIRGEMAVYRSPRDLNFPVAEYWPGGVLPTGPDYAPHGKIASEGDIRTIRERQEARRAETMRDWFPTMADHVYGFTLEPTPENIDAPGMAEAA